MRVRQSWQEDRFGGLLHNLSRGCVKTHVFTQDRKDTNNQRRILSQSSLVKHRGYWNYFQEHE